MEVKMKQEISADDLGKFVELNADIGKLYWKPRDFSSLSLYESRHLKIWNGRFAGKLAFNRLSNQGYLQGGLLGRTYSAHRVVWALFHGEWPDGLIDHINRDRTDNRPSNLRVVDAHLNCCNRKVGVRSRSGFTGVAVMPDGRFHVTIHHGGKKLYCGIYTSLDEAVARRRMEEKKYGYLSNLIVSGQR
jgi:hypothetical protein